MTEAEFRAKHEAKVVEAMAKAIYTTRACVEDPPWELLYPEDQEEFLDEAVAALAAYRAAMWMPMREAPEDAHILVGTNGAHSLPPFTTIVKYHPDGGWCVDELREPIACQPLPLPPTEEPK